MRLGEGSERANYNHVNAGDDIECVHAGSKDGFMASPSSQSVAMSNSRSSFRRAGASITQQICAGGNYESRMRPILLSPFSDDALSILVPV